MTTTPDLGLPELAQSQANPDITHNEALVLIQALLNGVISRSVSAPPGSPTEGDAYIIADGSPAASGAWVGRANSIAIYRGGAWRFVPGNDDSGSSITMGARHEGLRIFVRDEGLFYVWTGSPMSWVSAGGVPLLASQIVNTPAGTIAATTVQAAINELDGDIQAHIADTTAAHAASAISNTPAGTIAATTVQAALDELDTEKVARSGDTMTGALVISGAGLTTRADGAFAVASERYSNDQGAPFNTFKKGRGTAAAPSDVVTNDQLGQVNFRGRAGSTGGPDNDGFFNGANIRAVVTAATPSSTDMQARLILFCTPAASVTATEIMRLEHATGLSMFGANVVIDQDRVFRMRAYTVATLPAVAAGKRAYVTDSNAALTAGIGAVVAGGGANVVPVFSDAGNWRIG